MKGLEEPTAAAMKGNRHADIAVLLDNVTKNAELRKVTTKAGDNISYTDFAEWKSKDLIDDN
jgi:co-chaperonin GroES (HSP10)